MTTILDRFLAHCGAKGIFNAQIASVRLFASQISGPLSFHKRILSLQNPVDRIAVLKSNANETG